MNHKIYLEVESQNINLLLDMKAQAKKLMKLVSIADIPSIKLILDEISDIINFQNRNGQTAL